MAASPIGAGGVSEPGFLSQAIQWFTDPMRWSGEAGIPNRLLEHVITSGVAVAIAAAVAIPLGLLIGHTRRGAFVAVSVANLGRAVPSFGLIVLFVLVFGLGLGYPEELRPAVLFAMVLLAIPPILVNTYVGVQAVDPDAIEAARGMGMTEWQLLVGVEVPVALPVIIAGLRTAAVQVVATATLAALVAGGGLGRFIIDGLAVRDLPELFGGAILVALLAIATELLFAGIERLTRPRAARGKARPVEPAGPETAAAA